VLAAAVIGSMPVARLARAVALGADLAWLGTVFALASASLAAGTYNPFIYFRF
jgi:NAD(P)H-dependent flavin oxidoreductase YrpB (nitropropane dioxygenase family)